jgi:hypothetical protein
MIKRSISVKVVDESKSKVTLYFYSLNRKMPVSKEDFKQRVESGLYEVKE